MSTWTRAALTVLIGLIIWFFLIQRRIKPEGWHLLAILRLRLLVLFCALGRRVSWHSLALLLLWQRLYYDGTSFGAMQRLIVAYL